MTERARSEPYWEPPEAGVGGEGPIQDLSGLAASTDTEIASAVHAAFVLDLDIDDQSIGIQVIQGVVRLTGRSASPDARRRAVEVAGRVHGVQRVIDQMAA
jgi:osmotically-inducible protein OsmY